MLNENKIVIITKRKDYVYCFGKEYCETSNISKIELVIIGTIVCVREISLKGSVCLSKMRINLKREVIMDNNNVSAFRFILLLLKCSV